MSFESVSLDSYFKEDMYFLPKESCYFSLVLDLEYKIFKINKTVTGIEMEDVIGVSAFKFVDKNDHKILKDSLEKTLKTHTLTTYEVRAVGPNGTWRYYRTEISPIIKESNVLGFYLTSLDVTPEKELEIKVKENQIKKSQEVTQNISNQINPLVDKLKNLEGIDGNIILDLESSLKSLQQRFSNGTDKNFENLTFTEVKICHLIKKGLLGKEIAGLLGISFSTVETHKKNIRKKLALTNTSQNLPRFLRESNWP